jgi:hypothetical protein
VCCRRWPANRHANADGFFVQLLGRQVPVPLCEQQIRQSHALARRAEAGIAQAQGRIAVGGILISARIA